MKLEIIYVIIITDHKVYFRLSKDVKFFFEYRLKCLQRNLAQILSYPYSLKPCKKFPEILFVAFELGVSIQSPFVSVNKGQI